MIFNWCCEMGDNPILWEFKDKDIVDELSRIEYYYGTVDKNGVHTYHIGANREERDRAVMASALKRILTLLTFLTPKTTESVIASD